MDISNSDLSKLVQESYNRTKKINDYYKTKEKQENMEKGLFGDSQKISGFNDDWED